MTYELWSGELLLGRSTLDFPTTSPMIFSGEFEPVADQENFLAEIAVAMYCLIAWMHRDVRDPLGHHQVKRAYRNSRLFDDISKVVESRNVSLQLRHSDGRIIPTSCLVVQDMETLPTNAELVPELMAAEDEEETDDTSLSFQSDDEHEPFIGLEPHSPAEPYADSYHSDFGDETDDDDGDYGWDFNGGPPPLRPRFHLHATIKREGDIPADNTVKW